MPRREWIVDLGEGRVLVSRNSEGGAVREFTVVLLFWIDGEWVRVTRYDCAHGFPHQDVLGRKGGLLYKREFPGLTLGQVFDHAIRDFKANSENYLRDFLAR